MKDNKLSIFYIKIIPLIMLISLSSYWGYTSWENYNKDIKVEYLNNSSISLQKLEISSLNELLCNSGIKDKECNKIKVTTDKLIKQAKMLKIDIYRLINKSIYLKNIFIQNNISDFIKIIDKKKYQKITSNLSKYISEINSMNNNYSEHQMITLYSELIQIIYATELDKIFTKIYISEEKPISSKISIFWNRVIRESTLDKIELNKYNSYGEKLLHRLLLNKDFQKKLNKIGKIHREIFLPKNSKKYTKNASKLIKLLDSKEDFLYKIEIFLTKKIDALYSKRNYIYLMEMLISLFTIVITFLSLLYIIRDEKTVKDNKRKLHYIADYISNFSMYSDDDDLYLKKIYDDIKDDSDLFFYIKEGFDILDKKSKGYAEESKSKSEFLSILSNEISTPIHTLIEFTQLLRDMGVTLEQEEFLTVIEKSSYHLISILNDILDLSDIHIVKTNSIEKDEFPSLDILVADDNSRNRELMKSIFEKFNFNITFAKDGKEAVKVYKKSKFDMVFMDIQMPIMNGIDATKTILKYEKDNNLEHTPIVALSVNNTIKNKEEYISEGLDDSISKPLKIDEIKDILKKFTTI